MSLIIEALKKARDDAVRRQAAARGLPLAPVPRLERRGRWLNLAIIPLAAALVICILLLADVYSRIPEVDATESPTPTQRSDAALAREVTAEISAPAQSPPAAEASQTAAEVPMSVGDRPRNDDRERLAPTPAPPPEVVASSRVVEAPSAEALPSQPVGPREFIGQAQLADGQLLDLGGIAWSESDPYALINGQVVGTGELIRSYRILSISPDEVILEKDGDRVVLRLD